MRAIAIVVLVVCTAQPLDAQDHRSLFVPPGPTITIRLPLNESPRAWFKTAIARRRSLELVAVAATGVGQIVFSELGQSRVYIPIVAIGWSGYVFHRARQEPGYLQSAGFTSVGLRAAARDASITAGISLGVMAGIGAARGNLSLHEDMVPLLLLYPAWGLVQQFLVQRMVAVNLSSYRGGLGSPYFVVPATATAFGSVHLPNFELAGGTFALGLAFTPIYLRQRNLWPLSTLR